MFTSEAIDRSVQALERIADALETIAECVDVSERGTYLRIAGAVDTYEQNGGC